MHRAWEGVGIGHAIGGALALAYHVGEARATQDVDLNVALPRAECRRALESLPTDCPWGAGDVAAIERDGQVRLRWPVGSGPPMPLDLFFAEHEFHGVAQDRVVYVKMLDADVPILTATDLIVFKALFDRPKDWVDIAEMLTEDPPSLDRAEAVTWVGRIVGDDDPRTRRLADLSE